MIGVLGATGTTGGLLTKRLSDCGIATRALAHRADTAAKLDLFGVEVQVGNYDNDDVLKKFLVGLDQLFLLTVVDERQAETQNHIIDLAADLGVGAITKLSAWTSADDSPLTISRSHHAIERHLERSGVPYTVLQSHTFMQTLAEAFGQEIRTAGTVSSSVTLDAGIFMVDVRDLVDVATEVLVRNDHRGETLVIHGPEPLSYAMCAQRISERLGRDIRYQLISADEVAARFEAAGMSAFYTDIFVTLFDMYSAGTYEPEINTVIEDWTGHKPRSFSDFLDEYVELFA